LHPFEEKQRFKPKEQQTHFLRPIYNQVFYPLRWFYANGKSFKKECIKNHYGWKEEPLLKRPGQAQLKSLQINTTETTTLMIGFTAEEEILQQFDSIKNGQYVKMTFGSALSPKGDFFINRLISVESIDLSPDPRIPVNDETDEKYESTLRVFDNLKGAKKECAMQYVLDYTDRVRKHRWKAGYAENTTYDHAYIHSGVLNKAMTECNASI